MWGDSQEVDVRPAGRSDVAALSQVLSRAFYDDPVARWEVPDDATRRKKLHHLWAAFTYRHHLAGRGVEVAWRNGSICAAALWDPPNRWQLRRREEMLMLPRLTWAFGTDTARSDMLIQAMKDHHPATPHWYLAVIGSDAHVRGLGYGHALMRSRLDRCDAERLPAYLESTNPTNLPYYQRYGFEVTGEIALPQDGPGLWAMWREPR